MYCCSCFQIFLRLNFILYVNVEGVSQAKILKILCLLVGFILKENRMENIKGEVRVG